MEGHSSEPASNTQLLENDEYTHYTQKLLPSTSRVAFLDVIGPNTATWIDSNSAVPHPDLESDMASERVAMFDNLFKEALWMCDVVLETRINESQWQQYFQDHRYHSTIIKIFTWVRAFLSSLVQREDVTAKGPIFAKKQLKIYMVFCKSPGNPNTIALMAGDLHTILCWESFLHGWNDHNGIASNDLRENISSADGYVSAARLCSTRAAVVLHELIHYITYLKWPEICESVHCEKSKGHIIFSLVNCIIDVNPFWFANKISNVDQDILKLFEVKKWKTRRGTKFEYATAYRPAYATELARLQKWGALAAFLNCDSHVSFASGTVAEYLNASAANGYSTDDVLLREPRQKFAEQAQWETDEQGPGW